MSRTSKAIISIPNTIKVMIYPENLSIVGKHGQLSIRINKYISIENRNNQLILVPKKQEKRFFSLLGTTRTLIKNMIIGVTNRFSKTLQLVGVGYRASVKDKEINLLLGFSHPIRHSIPNGIFIECPNQTEIVIVGIDKQLVGQVAADLRLYKKPEPYKGKGIRYINEKIKIKEAKKK